MNKEEIWKDIVGFEGRYQVSDTGNVRSLDKIGWNNNLVKGQSLKPSDNKGYLRVSLYKNGKTNNWKLIHRLVAQAFIPNPENKPQVNHKNFCKSDNNVENLEWATKQEDMSHLAKSGRLAGENSVRSKLTWDKVKQIRKEYLEDRHSSHLTLAKKYNISKGVITGIVSNRYWCDKEYQKVTESEIFKLRLKTASTKGEFNHTAKLNENQVLEIRQSYKDGESRKSLSKRFSISINHINLIIRRGTWKHI